jgi:hypothetical protein
VGAAGVLCAEDAQPEGDTPREPFALDWWTVDGGGGPAAGDGFELLATIGQTDVGVSIGEDYVLQSGFLPGGDIGVLFVDGFESGTTDRWDSTVGDGW